MKRLLSLCVLALVAACGPVTSTLTDGTFTSRSDSILPNAQLVLDKGAKTATVTHDGGAPVVLNLAAVPQASWDRGCPTNFSSVLVETFTVTPDPAVIGGVSMGSPKLTAGCGLDSADPNTVRLEGQGDGGVQLFIHFQRLQR